MYTELKELINFLAIYMHRRIPRRRISLFMESYGNYLAGRFLENWKLEEPKYGERERILLIKTGNRLNELFITIARNIGIIEEDLTACFPSPMFLYCNPGEVYCQMMNYTYIITVWMGDVNADINYTPIPSGIAFFCETPAILYNFLNSDDRGCFGPKNKMRSERCIFLQLLSCMDDYAHDLLEGGFFLENRIPPFLFRCVKKEDRQYTARAFSITRFGTHRPRPDYEALRRIQHDAALLAIIKDYTCNAASGSHQDNAQFAINPTGNSFYDNHPYANSNFTSTITSSVPLTSPPPPVVVAAAAATVSVGQGICDGMDHTKVNLPACDERNNSQSTYPCHSRTSIADNYNSYPFETASPSNINYTPAENPKNQIHNLKLNDPDIADLQHDISRMSFVDGAAPASSTLVSYHTKMY